MKRVIKIEIEGSGGCCYVPAEPKEVAMLNEMGVLCGEAEPGSWVKFTVEEMDEEKFENLKEFEGW